MRRKEAIVIALMGIAVLLSQGFEILPINAQEINVISVTYQFDESEILNWLDTRQFMMNLEVLSIAGEPLTPYKVATILLPQCTEVAKVSVVGKLEGQHIVEDIPCGQPPTIIGEEPMIVEKDPNIYCSNKSYPEEIYLVGSVDSFRGYNILHVRLYPVRYKPASKLASYYNEMTVHVELTEESTMNTIRNLAEDRETVRKMVDNPSVLSTYDSTLVTTETLNTTYEYIIVTTPDLADEFQVLADWKSNCTRLDGAKVVTVNVNASDTEIKNVINDYYTNYGTSYVLLGGDVGVIINHTKIVVDPIAEDYWYANLRWEQDEEEISYYEVYIGRAPVDNSTEATNFVNKVIAYEQMEKPEANAFHAAKIVENWPDERQYAYDCQQYIPEEYVNYTLFEDDDADGISKTEWASFWNNNVTLLVHGGHSGTLAQNINYGNGTGGSVSYGVTDINGYCPLNNTFWPVHTSWGCNVAKFNSEQFGWGIDCIGEEYVKDPDNGAVAVLGNHFTTWLGVSEEFVVGQFRALYQDRWKSIGAMHAHSKYSFIDLAKDITPWEQTWRGNNLIGDPETRLLKDAQNVDTGLEYRTIQEAIDAPETQDGHTIVVWPGTYYEHVVVSKSLTISGKDPSTTIIDANGTGYVFTLQANNSAISNFTIQNGDFGVRLNSVNNTLSNNIVSNNTAYGIWLNYSSDNLIVGNTISNHSDSNDLGIYLFHSNNNTINNNTISNNKVGISLYEGSNGNTIMGNTILNSEYVSVELHKSSGNTFYHNNFIGNTQVHISPGTSYHTWDDGYPSGGNYWSDYTGTDLYSGPYQNETGSDGIGDTPYVINQYNQDNYPLIRPFGSIRNIDTGLRYITIQKAIDDTETIDGHTIEVKAGTYYENVEVDKSVSLIGENRETTIVDANGTGSSFWLPYVNNVTISGFTIQRGNADGIVVSGGGGISIVDNIVRNCLQGIVLFGCTDSSIVGNIVTNITKYGIYLNYDSDGANISGNTVTDNLVYGILLMHSDDASISGNVVADSGSTGIYLHNSNYANITENLILNNLEGLHLANSVSDDIHHNNFIGNTQQVHISPGTSYHTWDDGYPSGGNYWNDYNGTDLYSGPYQNETGSDGIGDTPYVINQYNQDNYPLISPWELIWKIRNIDTGVIYLTIQKAINDTKTIDGHTIEVKAGTYYENVVVDKSLTIIGEDPSTTIIDANETGNVITVQANNVNIEGFTIQNGEYGIYLNECNYSTVSGNWMLNNTRGIYLFKSDNNTITENRISNNNYGIYLYQSEDNVIHHNNFIDNNKQRKMIGSVNNEWNSTNLVGNYWNKYNGSDTNGDGIGDTDLPHQGVDDYPLMWKWFPGDLDGDGYVGRYDFGTFAYVYGTEMGDPRYYPLADFDYDGDIDRYDYSTFSTKYGKSIPY